MGSSKPLLRSLLWSVRIGSASRGNAQASIPVRMRKSYTKRQRHSSVCSRNPFERRAGRVVFPVLHRHAASRLVFWHRGLVRETSWETATKASLRHWRPRSWRPRTFRRFRVRRLRQWMITDGLWIDPRHRLPSPHRSRRRRECLGELVQIDGSGHAWFEDCGPVCTLLAFIGDATSRIMLLRFVASGFAFDHFSRDPLLPRDLWQAGRVPQRQAQYFPSRQQGCRRR